MKENNLENLSKSKKLKSPDINSYTYTCPTCKKTVTAYGPREMLNKTEQECNICQMEKNGTMAQIVEQEKQRQQKEQNQDNKN